MIRRGIAGLVVLLCLAPLAAPPPAAAQDELVPAGVWRLHAELAARSESRAWTRLHSEGPLLDILVPDDAVRGALQGGVERDVLQSDLLGAYGVSDTWNLALRLTWRRVAQRSSVSADPANAAAQAEAGRLGSRTVSGLGRLHLASLSRPIFLDRHSLALGYGVDWPLRRPESLWAGRSTLLVDPPFPRVFGLLHYTFYPFYERTRVDLRAEGGVAVTQRRQLQGGGFSSVNPGNDLALSLGWGQEWGALAGEAAYLLERHGESRLNVAKQGDAMVDNRLRLRLGYGNLNALERAPVAFPFQAQLTYEHSVRGFNAPIRRELRLGLQFYF